MSVSHLLAHKRLRKIRTFLERRGWSLNGIGREIPDNTLGPTLYLCNIETGHLELVALCTDGIDRAQTQAAKLELSFETICNNLNSLYLDISKQLIKVNEEYSDLLSFLAAAYIGGTQGYNLMKAQDVTSDYLIIQMTEESTKALLLRPVPIQARSLYRPEEIENLVEEVLAIDRQRHPERFNMAKVIPFHVKS